MSTGRRLAAIAACFLVAAAWSDVSQLLPTSAEMKGWKEVAGSFVHAKGDALTNLYDGGYKLYLDHGVVDAAQRIYQKGTQYVTVTVHAMRDAKSAGAFVGYWNRANSRETKRPTPAPGKGFSMVANGATTIYWARGRTFATISVPSAAKEAVASAVSALKVVARKAKP